MYILNSAHVYSFVASTLYANCNQIQFVVLTFPPRFMPRSSFVKVDLTPIFFLSSFLYFFFLFGEGGGGGGGVWIYHIYGFTIYLYHDI